MGKPVLVLREATERPEVLTSGVARLVGTNPDEIVRVVRTLLEDDKTHERMAVPVSPYGDGHATARIMATLAYSRRSGAATGRLLAFRAHRDGARAGATRRHGGTLRCSRDLMRFGLLEILVLLLRLRAFAPHHLATETSGRASSTRRSLLCLPDPVPQRGTGDRSNNQEPPRRS